ncbi:hypothetical protein AAJCM20276_00080 [Acetobacter aceti]|uniref:Uncharacterized protein n=1 Tax=Acetobacter aceti TaxID=435 RepID=A0A6S6PJH2_ACEAC|nr:hypothetical protein AAJCM20276_00080 [Acetobacter aceti]
MQDHLRAGSANGIRETIQPAQRLAPADHSLAWRMMDHDDATQSLLTRKPEQFDHPVDLDVTDPTGGEKGWRRNGRTDTYEGDVSHAQENGRCLIGHSADVAPQSRAI